MGKGECRACPDKLDGIEEKHFREMDKTNEE